MSPAVRVKKGAQLGFTEALQNMVTHAVDFQKDSMVVFPTDDTAKRHSKARFKALLESSDYIAGIFQEINSVDVKRSMDTALYFEGSNGGDALYSVPVEVLVIDEVDRCKQDALLAAEHRLDGCAEPRDIRVSTPTYPGFGIQQEYEESDQKRWMCPCPHCGERVELGGPPELEEWPIRWEGWPDVPPLEKRDAVADTATLLCQSCDKPWTNEERLAAVAAGKWIARYPDRRVSGYEITQLVSPTLTVRDMVYRYFKAKDDPNPERMRQYVNQVLAQTYLGEGEEVTREMVDRLKVKAKPRTVRPGLCVGADIGKGIHVAMGRKEQPNLLRVEHTTTLKDWNELENLVRREEALSVVVDQNPEQRASEKFCDDLGSLAFRAYHPEAMPETYQFDVKRQLVRIKHVDAADILLSRVRKQTLVVEKAGDYEEMCKHLLRINVVLELNSRGIPERRVVKMGVDHYAFALMYLEAAAHRVFDMSDVPDFEPDPSLNETLQSMSFEVPLDAGLRSADIFGNEIDRWKEF